MNPPVSYFLIVAHGSRRIEANAEIAALACQLQNCLPRYTVRHAFLELAQPSIPDALEKAIAEGAALIQILPYFLTGGVHVTTDIPEILDATQRRHPRVTLRQLPHCSADAGWINWLAQKATDL